MTPDDAIAALKEVAEYRFPDGDGFNEIADVITALLASHARYKAALEPFAAYASLPGFEKLHDDMAVTSGSRIAARQVTVKEFRAALAALTAGETELTRSAAE